MNKTEARFTTTSKGQVAFLLWKDILPQRLDITNDFPLFIYMSDNDYTSIMQSYWRGDSIPACEMGECILIVDRIIERGKIIREVVEEGLERIEDYKEWYSKQITMGDFIECDPTILNVLERKEPIFNSK